MTTARGYSTGFTLVPSRPKFKKCKPVPAHRTRFVIADRSVITLTPPMVDLLRSITDQFDVLLSYDGCSTVRRTVINDQNIRDFCSLMAQLLDGWSEVLNNSRREMVEKHLLIALNTLKEASWWAIPMPSP